MGRGRNEHALVEDGVRAILRSGAEICRDVPIYAIIKKEETTKMSRNQSHNERFVTKTCIGIICIAVGVVCIMGFTKLYAQDGLSIWKTIPYAMALGGVPIGAGCYLLSEAFRVVEDFVAVRNPGGKSGPTFGTCKKWSDEEESVMS